MKTGDRLTLLMDDRPVWSGTLLDPSHQHGTPHDCVSFRDGCFRCDLNRDEMGVGDE